MLLGLLQLRCTLIHCCLKGTSQSSSAGTTPNKSDAFALVPALISLPDEWQAPLTLARHPYMPRQDNASRMWQLGRSGGACKHSLCMVREPDSMPAQSRAYANGQGLPEWTQPVICIARSHM